MVLLIDSTSMPASLLVCVRQRQHLINADELAVIDKSETVRPDVAHIEDLGICEQNESVVCVCCDMLTVLVLAVTPLEKAAMAVVRRYRVSSLRKRRTPFSFVQKLVCVAVSHYARIVFARSLRSLRARSIACRTKTRCS